MCLPDSSVGKESACNAGDPVRFLGWEDPLEKGQATHSSILGLSCCSDGRESACNAGDLSSIPGLGRSAGGGHGNPLQYSCLENPMDRGIWQAMVHRVAKSWTLQKQLSMHACHLQHFPKVSLACKLLFHFFT